MEQSAQDFDENLIIEFQKHPILRNKSLSEFKDKGMKKNAWKSIADALGYTGELLFCKIRLCSTHFLNCLRTSKHLQYCLTPLILMTATAYALKKHSICS